MWKSHNQGSLKFPCSLVAKIRSKREANQLTGRLLCHRHGVFLTALSLSHRDYILDRFTVGLDLTRRRTRIMTMILEPLLDRNKKWCPSDRDICRLVPIWIQIYVAPSLMLMAVHNGNKWFMTHHPTCPISSFPG